MDEYFQPEQNPAPQPASTVPTFVTTPLINIVTRPDGTKYAVPRFVWDADKTQAAADLAEGMRLSEVAARAGVGPGTLKQWRDHPEFAARVEEHRKAFRELVWNHSIANEAVRLQRLIDMDEQHEQLRLARAAEMADVPGGDTGLIFAKPTANGTEYRYDRAFVAQRVELLKEIQIQKGERNEGSGGNNLAVQIVVPAGLPKPEDVKTVTIGRQG